MYVRNAVEIHWILHKSLSWHGALDKFTMRKTQGTMRSAQVCPSSMQSPMRSIIIFKDYKKNTARQWWCMPLIQHLRGKSGGSLRIQGQPGLQSKFQDRLKSYTEKHCLKKLKPKQSKTNKQTKLKILYVLDKVWTGCSTQVNYEFHRALGALHTSYDL